MVFPDIAELLHREGACLTAQDYAGYTPLHLIRDISDRGMTTIDFLLPKGADHSIPTHNGDKPIHSAIKRSRWSVFERLIDTGASVNDKGARGRTVLHIAAIRGKASFVELLVEMGVDLDDTDEDGWTALQDAVRGGRTETVTTLLKCQNCNGNEKVKGLGLR